MGEKNPVGKRNGIIGSVENLILFIFLLTLKKYEGDPLFPPKGEAPQGVYPLDPLLQSGKPYER